MKVFAINLERSPERRASIVRECRRYALDFELVEAADGGALTPEERRRALFDPDNNPLSAGEIGCALSHLKVYRKIVDQDIPAALILEDDIGFLFDPRPLLDALDALDASESVVYPLVNGKKVFFRKPVRTIGGFAFHRAFSFFGAYGYVLTRAAADNLARLLDPVRVHADNWSYILGSGAATAWVSETCFLEHLGDAHPSTIAPERDARRADRAERRRRKWFRCRVYWMLPFSLRMKRLLRWVWARNVFAAKTCRRANRNG